MAIAVPIFTGELQKAKVARDKANIRAVKAAAIANILNGFDKGTDMLGTASSWYAVGMFDTDGNLTKISAVSTAALGVNNSEPGKINYASAATSGIEVQIKAVELSTT